VGLTGFHSNHRFCFQQYVFDNLTFSYTFPSHHNFRHTLADYHKPKLNANTDMSNFARIHFSANRSSMQLRDNAISMPAHSYVRTDDEAHRLASTGAKVVLAIQRHDEQGLTSSTHVKRDKYYLKWTKEHDDAIIAPIERSSAAKKEGDQPKKSAFATAFGARKGRRHRETVKKAVKKMSRFLERKLEAAAANRRRECQNMLPLGAYSCF
jgi:hypothetical protein